MKNSSLIIHKACLDKENGFWIINEMKYYIKFNWNGKMIFTLRNEINNVYCQHEKFLALRFKKIDL